LLMLLALFIFYTGRKQYKMKPAAKSFTGAGGESLKAQLMKVWKVLLVFCFIPIFWALYDQNGSEWVIQAGKMDLHFMGVDWLQEQIQVVNALLILVLIPLFSFVVYPYMEKLGIRVTALRKIGWGLLLTTVTFCLVAWIQMQIDAGIRLSIGWQLLAYTLLTIAEIFVSITGLEYAFSQAPKSMKSTIMAIFFVTVFAGNFLVTLVNDNIRSGGFFSRFEGASYFWLFAGIMLVNAILYYLTIYIFKVEDTSASEVHATADVHQ